MRTFRFIDLGSLALAFCIVLGVFAMPALAQDSSTELRGGAIWATVAPYLFTTISAAVIAVLTWLAELFRRWTGIQIEAKHREALHSAAMTGVAAAFTKIGEKADTLTIDAKSEIIRDGVDWVFKSVPDALAHFNVTPQSIATLVESKLAILLQSKTTEPALVAK